MSSVGWLSPPLNLGEPTAYLTTFMLREVTHKITSELAVSSCATGMKAGSCILIEPKGLNIVRGYGGRKSFRTPVSDLSRELPLFCSRPAARIEDPLTLHP